VDLGESVGSDKHSSLVNSSPESLWNIVQRQR